MGMENRVGTDSPDVVEEDIDIQLSPPEQESILFQATTRRPTRSKMASITEGGEEEKFPRPQESRVVIALDEQSGTVKHYSAKPGKMPRRFEGKHHDDYPKTSQNDPRLGQISFDASRTLTTALKQGTSVTSWPTKHQDINFKSLSHLTSRTSKSMFKEKPSICSVTIEVVDRARRDMFECCLATGCGSQFLIDLENWQRTLRPYSIQIDEYGFLHYLFTRLNVKGPPEEPTPTLYARSVWLHEKAHEAFWKRLKVASQIQIARLPDGAYQPFLEVSVAEFASVAKTDADILWMLGESLLEPERQGVDYNEETKWGKRFLQKARELERGRLYF